MSVINDIRRMRNLPDAEVSSKFKGLVDGYVKDLTKNKSKGSPGTGSIPSVRVGKIRRKKGQLIPSEILFAMRETVAAGIRPGTDFPGRNKRKWMFRRNGDSSLHNRCIIRQRADEYPAFFKCCIDN